MNENADNISCCDACGGPVVRRRALDGAKFVVPMSVESLKVSPYIDQFIYDRLRRAEVIIVDLRQQLKDKT